MSLKVAVLIPAAGASRRHKGKRKKQFTDVDGRAVFLRSIERFADREDVSRVIVAIPAEDEELFEVKWGANLGFYGVKHVIGGQQRHDTINRMLEEVDDTEVDLIAVHDAVRPCVSTDQIDAVFAVAAETGAAILARRLTGTIKLADEKGIITETLDRTSFWEAQTPQVFKPDILRKAYAQREKLVDDITDDAQLVEAMGVPVKLVESDSGNIKITQGADLAIASAILKRQADKAKPKRPLGPFAGDEGW